MRKILIMALCLLASYLPGSLLAKATKIGNFPIDAVTKFGSFILDDGRSYKPISPKQRKSTRSWELGDTILLMKKRGSKNYILINTRTGEISKMKVVPL